MPSVDDAPRGKEMPENEYKSRVAKTQQLMGDRGIDALILFALQNWTYYTGYRETWDAAATLEDPRCAIIPRNGDPVLVTPGWTAINIADYTWLESENIRVYGPTGWTEASRESNNPIRNVVNVLKDLGFDKKVIGAELGGIPGISFYWHGCTYNDFQLMRSSLPKAKFVDVTRMICEQRSIKTPWEIVVYRKLTDALNKSIIAGFEYARAGVYVTEVHEVMVKTAMSELGTDLPVGSFQSLLHFPGGELSPLRELPRPSLYKGIKLKKGDELYTDCGPIYRGYTTDLQRNLVIGEPSEKSKALHRMSLAGVEAMERVLKPYVKSSELYKAAMIDMKEVSRDIGHQWEFIGHSIGLRVHEWPFLSNDASLAVKPGMIFILETCGFPSPVRVGNSPMTTLYELCWQNVEDMYVMKEDGWERLTEKIDREIWTK